MLKGMPNSDGHLDSVVQYAAIIAKIRSQILKFAQKWQKCKGFPHKMLQHYGMLKNMLATCTSFPRVPGFLGSHDSHLYAHTQGVTATHKPVRLPCGGYDDQ